MSEDFEQLASVELGHAVELQHVDLVFLSLPSLAAYAHFLLARDLNGCVLRVRLEELLDLLQVDLRLLCSHAVDEGFTNIDYCFLGVLR